MTYVDVDYFSKQDIAERAAKETEKELSPSFKKLEELLAAEFAKVHARLDIIEQAVADPGGPAAEKLQFKHGIKKPKVVIGIGDIRDTKRPKTP